MREIKTMNHEGYTVEYTFSCHDAEIIDVIKDNRSVIADMELDFLNEIHFLCYCHYVNENPKFNN